MRTKRGKSLMGRRTSLDRRRFLAAGLGFSGLAALGCAGASGTVEFEPPPPQPRPLPTLTPGQQALVKGQNDFAVDLYGKLRQKDGNQFFSPFSVSAALGLTAAGARGETAAE